MSRSGDRSIKTEMECFLVSGASCGAFQPRSTTITRGGCYRADPWLLGGVGYVVEVARWSLAVRYAAIST